VVFTAYAAAWPTVIETGIGTALMRHSAREEIYLIFTLIGTNQLMVGLLSLRQKGLPHDGKFAKNCKRRKKKSIANL